MTSIAPSPNSNSAPPNSTTTSSPPSSNDTPTSPAPTTAQPNATSDPPTPSPPSNSSNSSSSSPPPPPPPQAPPPAVSTAPPPESLSPPPPTPVVPTSEPPPSSPSPPPPSSVSSPPPTTTTPAADPPSSSPPPPPSPVVSPPPPKRSPPPDSPSPPTVTSPPPQEASPPPPSPDASPPPPSADSSPPLSSSSPPPSANPPKSSPAPPTGTPPPTVTPAPPTATPPKASRPAAPPPKDSPATPSPPINQTQPSPSAPPPSVPSALPPSNSSTNQSSLTPTQPMPTQPIEGPDSASTNPSENTNRTKSSGINTGGAVAIGVVVTIVVLSLIGVAFWFSRKKKRKFTGYHAGHVMPSPLGSSPVSDSSQTKAYSSAPLIGSGSASDFMYSSSESGVLSNSRSIFTYEELMEATSRFSAQNLLGEGGFGCVYKGILPDGREVAVKQLKLGGSQGEREFSAEVETISRVHHRHLVSLVGYCISDHQRLLVYDFVPNNTLHFHLHEEGRPVMDWATRVKVAIGAARGISYLHEDCHPRIIHRDIKSSNILLDNNFDAQVSDFGLAKLALDAYTHITTRVMGTFGYMAPEYASSGKLTEKSDVYSFGVVLLELITGRKPVDTSQPMGDESLVEWARPLMTDALDNREFGGLIDPRLEGYYVESEVFQMIEAAAACVRHSGAKRPRMGQVVRALEGIGDSTDLTNGIRPGQSEIFNTAQQSAEIRMFQRMAFGSQDYNSDMFSRSSWAS